MTQEPAVFLDMEYKIDLGIRVSEIMSLSVHTVPGQLDPSREEVPRTKNESLQAKNESPPTYEVLKNVKQVLHDLNSWWGRPDCQSTCFTFLTLYDTREFYVFFEESCSR